MKNLGHILIAILLGSMVAILAACGGERATLTPEPTEIVRVPTDSPVPEAMPVGKKMDLDAASLAPAADLRSYRSAMTIYAEGIDNDQEIQGTIEFLIEYTRDPLAQHIAISSKGFEDSEEALGTEMYVLKDTTYMKFGEEWFSMPADGNGSLDDAGLLAPDDMLGNTCGWKQQGDTEHNGIAVHHWTLNQADLAECMTAEQQAQMGEIADASGNLYVAVEGNYISHLDLVFEGHGLAMGVGSAEDRVEEGRVEFTFEMTDIDQPFTIQVPEEALASNAMPEDIPIPDDAEQLNNMFGMITFLSASTPQQVADHYKAEMSEYGWTQVSADEFGGTFMLEYAKGTRSASLIISTDQDTNKTSVLITVEGE